MEGKANHLEEAEVRAIDNLLPSLYKDDLLTDIECRIIVSTGQLPEKQSAFLKIMMSKSKETAAELGQLFWEMTHGLHAEEKLKLQESDHKSAKNELDSPLEANKNPMVNNTVIQCVFGFLPLDDIKNCRLVSRQWNSTAEVLLRKKATIHFRPDGLRPETFLAVSLSKFALPDLPFSAFKFSQMNTNLSWPKSELEDFFDKWGKNIKELNLHHIHIKYAHANDLSKLILLCDYDITPWFKNSSKITSLKIEGSEHDVEALNMSLSLGALEFLPKIKTFIMKGISIETRSEKEIIRMAPGNIELSNITCKRDGEILEQFRYNDFFDFSQAVSIRLSNFRKNMSRVPFDIGDQVFKTTDVFLNDISIENWEAAKGDVKNLELRKIQFIKKNNLKIQSLLIAGSAVDLFAIPETVERIEVINCDISCRERFSLPNLKFLKLVIIIDNLSQLTRFRLENCYSLKELVVCYYRNEETSLTRMFNVKRFPSSLQTLRITGRLPLYLADDCMLEIPGLIVLDAICHGYRFSDYIRIAKKFRSGTLVVVVNEGMIFSTDDIVKFLQKVMQEGSQSIFIGSEDDDIDIHLSTPFEGSWFSTFVDAKSNYYEFENSFGIVGKALTRDQFLNGCVSFRDESIPFFLKE